MKKLFIHHPVFRLVSPVLNGMLVYLLLLTIGNNVEQALEEFIGQELYVCIGLSLLIQESSRLIVVLFNRLRNRTGLILGLVLQLIVSVTVTVTMVSFVLTVYFDFFVGYPPSFEELQLFSVVFVSVSLIYLVLSISHQYLHKQNLDKLTSEEQHRDVLAHDFAQFKQGMNLTLLLESLETLIVLAHTDKERGEQLIDNLSSVYRYVLSARDKELVTTHEELEAVQELVSLLNFLPFRKIKIAGQLPELWIPPGTLLYIIEQIARKTILSEYQVLAIDFELESNRFGLKFSALWRLNATQTIVGEMLQKSYLVYTEEKVKVERQNQQTTIWFPLLQLESE